MKKTTNYIFAFVCAWTVFACARIEEPQFDEGAEMVEMTITATIADKTDTKTTLEGDLEDGVLQTMWTPDDAIGIGIAGGASNTKFEKFINIQTENSETGIFQGAISQADKYYAIYPHAGNRFQWNGDDHVFIINLPQTQIYKEGSFSSGTAPMIASAAAGEVFEFQNLCGLLALRLKGEERISSITFIAKNTNDEQMIISGDFVVKANNPLELLTGENYSAIVRESSKSVTLKCDNPVQLSTSDSTPFYFVLPPATYDKFTLIINTADGKVMMKEGKSPITIERAHAKPTAALQYAETVTVDLSEKGTANCYIIPEAGVYSFDANVMGNGDFGIVDGSHTTNPYISPAKVELLWEDKEGLIVGEDYSDGKITFVSTGMEGNAVIAAKDQSGTILWSWHIWCTDQPAEHVYVNSTGEYTVLDRNLGATRADRGESTNDWRSSIGTMYQFGRKDPFYASYIDDKTRISHYIERYTQFSVEESIVNPNTFAYGWEHWDSADKEYLYWLYDSKTIYDPCPPGYRISVTDIWKSFYEGGDVTYTGNWTEVNYIGRFNNGVNFLYDGTNTTWYPATTKMEWGFGEFFDECTLWGVHGDSYHPLEYHYRDYNSDYYISWYYTRHPSFAYPVRCMLDTETATLIASLGSITDVTSTSAKVTGKVSSYGTHEIIESGFVIGTDSNINKETGEIIYTDVTESGEITVLLTDLHPQTKYFIKVYAVTSERITYSDAKSFITPNADGVIDLSANGTANSYIVKPSHGTYSFDLVKGNSNIPIENVSLVEILWETYNTTETVVKNSVVASVKLDGNHVKFCMPETPISGNAVIAAKDSNGTILWSWHIWVVDFDPEISQQKYPSGAILMDRNLGALNIANNDSKSFGLLYQWGRKDPFPNITGDLDLSSGTFARTYPSDIWVTTMGINAYDYSISHPTHSLVGTEWNNDTDLWRFSKTMYDPCPEGWMIPEGGPGVWKNISDANWGKDNNQRYLPYIDIMDTKAYYPICGGVDSQFNIFNFGLSSYYYSSTSFNISEANIFSMGNSGLSAEYSRQVKDYLLSVRCSKEPAFNNNTNEGFTESDDYEW